MQQRRSAISAEQEKLHKALASKIALDGEERGPTRQLADRRFSNITTDSWMPRERVSHRNSQYRVVPDDRAQKDEVASQRRWRIELHGNESITDPILRLDVVGDTLLGRGSSIDVDLRAFNAETLGVSRRHALLRPTPNHLYLIDLNSTNGTLHNATPVTSGVARPLENNDVITLGKLIFTVRILGLVQPDDEAPGGLTHIGAGYEQRDGLPPVPDADRSEAAPAEEPNKHPTNSTLPIPRPAQLQETLLPDHIQRALKQLDAIPESAPPMESAADDANSLIAPFFGRSPAVESPQTQPTGPMAEPTAPDHSRLPDHIRQAAGETATQRIPDAISGLLRRWINHQDKSEDKPDLLLDHPKEE